MNITSRLKNTAPFCDVGAAEAAAARTHFVYLYNFHAWPFAPK